MTKEMFKTMIENFKEHSAEVNSKSKICNTSRTLAEVENIYYFQHLLIENKYSYLAIKKLQY